MTRSEGRVYFIGAGPGDPGLITLKARQLIEEADVILYAGSLVNPAVLDFCHPGSEILDTAHLKLEAQVQKMVESVRAGKTVARLHTGDPSLFGALTEQTAALDAAKVPFEIVPGVSAAFAAAAALTMEYTLPGATQTVIFTRMAGRTPVPESEELRKLALHRSSLVIFLSTGLLNEVVEELRAAGYPGETRVALVYRSSWPDEKTIRGTLDTIGGLAAEQELTHQGLIIVSPALDVAGSPASHLYGGYQDKPEKRKGTAILALTAPSIQTGYSLLRNLPDAEFFIPGRLGYVLEGEHSHIRKYRESIRQVLQSAFVQYEALICIMASGIVVRELAPLLKNKHSEPAVIVMDPRGENVVSLLGGHEGGANELAKRVARLTGGRAVITTASDHQGVPALDVLAKKLKWELHPRSRLAEVMAAMVNNTPVALVIDRDVAPPREIADFPWPDRFDNYRDALVSRYEHLAILTCRNLPDSFWLAAPGSAAYHLPVLAVGVGCNRGTGAEEILDAIQITFAAHDLDMRCIGCLATVTEKAGEAGLTTLCQRMGWALKTYDHEQIRQVQDVPNPSQYAMSALGVQGVSEPAALLASGATTLLVEKQKFANVTVAVAVQGGMS